MYLLWIEIILFAICHFDQERVQWRWLMLLLLLLFIPIPAHVTATILRCTAHRSVRVLRSRHRGLGSFDSLDEIFYWFIDSWIDKNKFFTFNWPQILGDKINTVIRWSTKLKLTEPLWSLTTQCWQIKFGVTSIPLSPCTMCILQKLTRGMLTGLVFQVNWLVFQEPRY